jgi:hypothetical protein
LLSVFFPEKRDFQLSSKASFQVGQGRCRGTNSAVKVSFQAVGKRRVPGAEVRLDFKGDFFCEFGWGLRVGGMLLSCMFSLTSAEKPNSSI